MLFSGAIFRHDNLPHSPRDSPRSQTDPISREGSWLQLQVRMWNPGLQSRVSHRPSGFPDSSAGKESACQCRRSWFNSWVSKICWRRDSLPTPVFLGFPCGSAGKESACNTGDLGLILGLGRFPGEGKGYPLQYSGLENSMDCIVHGVAKSQTWLNNFHFHGPSKTVSGKKSWGCYLDIMLSLYTQRVQPQPVPLPGIYSDDSLEWVMPPMPGMYHSLSAPGPWHFFCWESSGHLAETYSRVPLHLSLWLPAALFKMSPSSFVLSSTNSVCAPSCSLPINSKSSMHDNRYYLDLLQWSFHNIYKYQMLYCTWNQYNVSCQLTLIKVFAGTSLVVQCPPSNAGDTSSIPGPGTKIPHAEGQLSPPTTTTPPRHSRAHALPLEDLACCN